MTSPHDDVDDHDSSRTPDNDGDCEVNESVVTSLSSDLLSIDDVIKSLRCNSRFSTEIITWLWNNGLDDRGRRLNSDSLLLRVPDRVGRAVTS
uniref:Uncharacterized protein n=1 Tax=Ciona intestinalis TaxID=7719 RepID=H2Y1Q4_CIOIN